MANPTPRYTTGGDPEWEKLKKVVLECQPFKEGCATIVCVQCFRFLAFPSQAHKIQCGACNAVCSHVQAKCVACGTTMKVPLGSSEVQCPSCRFTFKPVAKMRVQVPEVLANNIPPPITLRVQIDGYVGVCAKTDDFQSRIIRSKPLSANIGAWELQSGASFHRVGFYKVKEGAGDVKLDASRTPVELGLQEGDVIRVIPTRNTDGGEGAGRSAVGSSGHDFQTVQFNSPASCGICSQFIWGFVKQGARCVRCSLPVHHRCAADCTSMCDAARRQLFGIVDFGGDEEGGDNAGDGETESDAVIAVPIEDPQAFMAACTEEVPVECDPKEMSKLSQLANFTDEQIADLWQKYDKDKSGVLEEEEAKQFLADCVMSFGTKMDPKDPQNKKVLDRLLRRLDTNENGVVEWDEFYLFFQAQKDVAFLQQFAGSKKEFTTEQLYEMWGNYDSDGSGELEVDEVLRLLSDITQTDPKTFTKQATLSPNAPPGAKKSGAKSNSANALTSFLKSGQKVTWDIFFNAFVPIIQDAVKNSKAPQ